MSSTPTYSISSCRLHFSKHEQDPVNIERQSFQLKLKKIPAGRYILKCTFDDDSNEYEYEKDKFFFYSKKEITISSASPNEAETSKAVNITVTGSGFVNTSGLACVLSYSGRSVRQIVKFKAEFVSNSEIVCYLSRVKLNGVFKLGILFSKVRDQDLTVDFSFYAVAPVPTSSRLSDDLAYIQVFFDKPAQPSSAKSDCSSFFNASSVKTFGKKPKCSLPNGKLRIVLSKGASVKVADKIAFLTKSVNRKFVRVTKHMSGKDEIDLRVKGPKKNLTLNAELSGSTSVGKACLLH